MTTAASEALFVLLLSRILYVCTVTLYIVSASRNSGKPITAFNQSLNYLLHFISTKPPIRMYYQFMASSKVTSAVNNRSPHTIITSILYGGSIFLWNQPIRTIRNQSLSNDHRRLAKLSSSRYHQSHYKYASWLYKKT